MDEESEKVLKKVLEVVEINQIPQEIQKKLEDFYEQRLNEFYTAKALQLNIENVRQDLETKNADLQAKLQDSDAKITSYDDLIREQRQQLDTTRQEVSKLQDTVARYESEVYESRREKNAAVDERDSLLKMVERRNGEVERQKIDIATLEQQLQAAIAAKCEVLAKMDDIESKEVSLNFKEKRLDQDKEMLQNQIVTLREDLNRNIAEMQTIRRDNTVNTIKLETKLTEKTEELRITQNSVGHMEETNASLAAKVEELNTKLRQTHEESDKVIQKFQKELASKSKLVEMLKESSSENQAQIKELSDCITELKKLLNEAAEKSGELETKQKSLELKHAEELEEKDATIQQLRQEIENANDLLKEVQEQNLEHAMQELAPSAAASSRLIKSGMTLTEIYSLYVKATEELQLTKKENNKINLQIRTILHELEEKAPLIRKQNLEYQKIEEANAELTHQLENLMKQRVESAEEHNVSIAKLSYMERENKKLKQSQADLGRQVCFLMKEIEQMRGGFTSEQDQSITSDMSANEVISKKLVTFGDIQELQENNQKLLNVVRDLSSKLEEMEEAENSMDKASYEAKIAAYSKRLSELQSAQEYQTQMMNVCMQQRDRFKKLYQEALKTGGKPFNLDGSFSGQDQMMEGLEEETPLASNSSSIASNDNSIVKDKKITELEAKIKDGAEQLKSLKEEYENYRKERATNEKMLNDQFETMRNEILSLTSSNCKLMSTVEFNSEQIKLQQKNVATYKKQIATLEDRNKNYENSIVKHEQTIMILKDEVLNSQTKLTRAEVMSENLSQENRILKDSEARLQLERESLHRERQSHQLLMNNLEMIKASFERSETEGKMRLESRLDEAMRECAALRRRLQEEQDRFRELTVDLERQTETAKKRMTDEVGQVDKIRDELRMCREEIAAKSKQIEDLSRKLQESLTPNKSDNPIAQAQKRVKEVELQNSEYRLEIESLQKELMTTKEHVQQYCKLSEGAEKELKVMSAEYETFKSAANAEITKLRESETALKMRMEELETEISLQITGAQLNQDQDESTQLRKTQTELRDVLQKLSEVNRELRDSRDEISSLRNALQSVEAKYANEMVLHSTDLQALSVLKEELNKLKETVGEFKAQRDRAMEELECSKRSWQETEKRLKADRVSVEERLTDLDAQNAALHDQIQDLSTRLTFVGAGEADKDDSTADTSLVNRSLTDADSNPGQLLQIIKYLRREKDIAHAEVDVLKAENTRLQSETKIIQKKLEETNVSLVNERTKSEVGIVSASKHEDILRKVETLNAITDSNRSLREERDLLQNKIKDLTAHIAKVEEELFPMQEKNREIQAKIDEREAENTTLRVEVSRWRQRANQLIERSNKTNPDIYKNLQNERESLAKMLTNEREILKKTNEELTNVKADKSRLDSEMSNLTKQVATLTEENKKHVEVLGNLQANNGKLLHELMDVKNNILVKEDEIKKLCDNVLSKDNQLADMKKVETQIRRIAKRYKEDYLKLKKDKEENPTEDSAEENQQNVSEAGTSSRPDTDRALQEKVTELNSQLIVAQEEVEVLKKEHEAMKLAREKDEKNLQMLKDAKARIMTLQESKGVMNRELLSAKTQLQSVEQSHDLVLSELKSQYETRLTRLEKELSEEKENKETISRLLRENESLVLRVNQLHRQLQMPQGAKASTSSSTTEKSISESPRTANVKPMAGPSHQSATVTPWRGVETPLASIRPMSVQNRTAAVLPTNVAAVQGSSSSVTALVPPQQQVHTTANNSGEAMSSSPTSSHTDYMPATSSAAVVVAAVPPMGTASTVAESSQEAESIPTGGNNGAEASFSSTSTSTQLMVSGGQQQQAVALVSPRVEGTTSQSVVQPQINEPQSQTPSTSGTSSSSSSGLSNQPVIIISHNQASSSSTVTTTQAGSHKRPRDVEGDSSTGTEEAGEKSQPQLKRTRVQAGETFQGVSESGLDVEYQVPTSSQRDQEDDIIVVDSEEEEEEDDGMADEGTPDDGPFDDEADNGESYEMESYEQEQEMVNYDEADGPDIDEDNVQSDNNEVEVDDSNEIPNQSGSSSSQIAPEAGSSTAQVGQSAEAAPEQPIEGSSSQSPQEIQQIQTISSGSGEAGSSTSVATPSSHNTWSRQVTPHSRQQQSAHLVLIQQSGSYEPETGDERIVPSTPTLFAPRRADGFSEVISSPHPQVPHAARFTFTETRPGQSALVPGGNLEGMDDTQIDLSQLDEANASTSGRSVPNTPKLTSPHDVDSAAGEGPSGTQPQQPSTKEEHAEEDEDDVDQHEDQQPEDLRQDPEAGTSQSQQERSGQDQGDDEENDDDEDDDDEGNNTASTSERAKSDKEDSNLPSEPEGTDGVSSEGEKAPGTEGMEIEEGREAEASTSPSINTRSRSAGHHVNVARRASGRPQRHQRIVWNVGNRGGRDPINTRGQPPVMQEPNSINRTPFQSPPRGQRGRRMRRPNSGNYMRY